MNKKLLWQVPFLLMLIVGTVIIIRQKHNMPWQHDEGKIFGTFYHLTYQSDRNLQKEIEAELMKVDCALSMFNDSSVISRINRGDSLVRQDETGKMFLDVYQLAMTISEETDGAFDITVAPLVNTWGFGFKNGTEPTPEAIDSIRQFIGFRKLSSHPAAGNRNSVAISKADPRTMLDCSAIAKGYGTDVAARLLRRNDVENFMVEIGGEVVVSGKNKSGEAWHIGVTKPTEDPESQNGELQAVLTMPVKTTASAAKGATRSAKLKSALATSGNYRNFYYKGGRRYAHTIDPKTGYPVQHNILSATVLAPTCAEADAYATAFMVLGLDGAKMILDRHPELLAYLICAGEGDNYVIWQSEELQTE
ncbi:MAG: FAD:protein FMN transferase [Prevotella sp.]|nr:FAD:protein FMN transferase [Prevotella sp.]